MQNGEQFTVVGYTWHGENDLPLSLTLLTNCRDFSMVERRVMTSGNFIHEMRGDKILIKAWEGASQLAMAAFCWNLCDGPGLVLSRLLPGPREHERGLADWEDNFRIGRLEVVLAPGESITLKSALDAECSVESNRKSCSHYLLLIETRLPNKSVR